MTHTPKLIGTLLIAAVSCLPLRAAESIDMRKRTTDLQSLRWGMFICWSFSTFSDKEWTPGVKDISLFKATGCDTDQWARTAKEAGTWAQAGYEADKAVDGETSTRWAAAADARSAWFGVRT